MFVIDVTSSIHQYVYNGPNGGGTTPPTTTTAPPTFPPTGNFVNVDFFTMVSGGEWRLS